MKKGKMQTVYLVITFSLLMCIPGFHSKARRGEHTDFIYKASSLQTGDIILRESTGFLGAVFKSFSLTEKKYSHAGFVLEENGKYYTCHFIDGNASGFTKDNLRDFISPFECTSFAVYRPSYSERQKQWIAASINDPLNKQLLFDDRFDLKSNNSLYCTEWIYKCMISAGFDIPFTSLNGVDYVAPDNLYINNFTQRITYVEYAPEI